MYVHDKKATPLQQMISALSGAIITTLVTNPLEVIKIRMQLTQPDVQTFVNGMGINSYHLQIDSKRNGQASDKVKTQRIGVRKAFRSIKQMNGIRGFWAGLGPSLMSALPSTIVYFLAYDYCKERLACLNQEDCPFRVYRINNVNMLTPLTSSTIARFLTAAMTTPFEMVRIQMQSERLSYGQVNVILKNIVATNGFGGLWYSLKPILLRDVPFSAIYWTVYETVKHYFPQNASNLSSSFISGAISGALAAILTTPFDVVTTNIQSDMGRRLLQGQTPGTLCIAQRLSEIYRLRGIEGLFAGLSMRLYKVTPSCAIMITTIECGNNYFKSINKTKYNVRSDPLDR